MIIACYNVYNEANFGFEESLKSVRDQVDQIVVVDGAYKNYPHKHTLSTDGTLELANTYADRVITCGKTRPWTNQIIKRNAYLVGQTGDTYIVIDGHEIWRGALKPPFSDHRIKMWMDYDKRWHWFFRMFNHRDGIEYRKFDYSLWVGDKELSNNVPFYPHGHLYHPLIEYNQEREEARRKYFSTPHRFTTT